MFAALWRKPEIRPMSEGWRRRDWHVERHSSAVMEAGALFDINATSKNARRREGDLLRIPSGEAPNPVENALSLPESDPERVAFNLWNEGRVDEAIQFLEREIATRRDGHEPGHEAGGEVK